MAPSSLEDVLVEHLAPDVAARLACVSTRWRKAADGYWGKQSYGLPYSHRPTPTAAALRRACSEKDTMLAHLPPLDLLPFRGKGLVGMLIAQIEKQYDAEGCSAILTGLLRSDQGCLAVRFWQTHCVQLPDEQCRAIAHDALSALCRISSTDMLTLAQLVLPFLNEECQTWLWQQTASRLALCCSDPNIWNHYADKMSRYAAQCADLPILRRLGARSQTPDCAAAVLMDAAACYPRERCVDALESILTPGMHLLPLFGQATEALFTRYAARSERHRACVQSLTIDIKPSWNVDAAPGVVALLRLGAKPPVCNEAGETNIIGERLSAEAWQILCDALPQPWKGPLAYIAAGDAVGLQIWQYDNPLAASKRSLSVACAVASGRLDMLKHFGPKPLTGDGQLDFVWRHSPQWWPKLAQQQPELISPFTMAAWLETASQQDIRTFVRGCLYTQWMHANIFTFIAKPLLRVHDVAPLYDQSGQSLTTYLLQQNLFEDIAGETRTTLLKRDHHLISAWLVDAPQDDVLTWVTRMLDHGLRPEDFRIAPSHPLLANAPKDLRSSETESLSLLYAFLLVRTVHDACYFIDFDGLEKLGFALRPAEKRQIPRVACEYMHRFHDNINVDILLKMIQWGGRDVVQAREPRTRRTMLHYVASFPPSAPGVAALQDALNQHGVDRRSVDWYGQTADSLAYRIHRPALTATRYIPWAAPA